MAGLDPATKTSPCSPWLAALSRAAMHDNKLIRDNPEAFDAG